LTIISVKKYPLLEAFGGGGCRFAICPYWDTANDNSNTHIQKLDLEKMPPVIQKFENGVQGDIITI
jgi:hypothetical protein